MALYLPGMGGNLKFGLLADGQSKWLPQAARVEARYRPGALLNDIQDSLPGPAGHLRLTVLALAEGEDAVVRVAGEHLPRARPPRWK